MVPRRALLRVLGLAATAGVAGCTALPSSSDETPSETDTATSTPTATASPTATLSPTPTGTPSPSPTPTVTEVVGTPALTTTPGDVDEVGHAVALDGATTVVVTEEHGAFVFERDDGWRQTAVLAPADAGNDDDPFGGHNVAAALAGDEAVIGGASAGGDGTGAAYLFARDADGWRQRHRFTSGEDTDEFGRAVAFDGDRVVVGDAHDPQTMVTWVGGAYVFERDGDDWTQAAALGTDAQDLFGTSVAVDGDTVLVGAPYASPGEAQTGAVYVYERAEGGWQRRTTLAPGGLADDSRFGQAVALDGERAVVGAPGAGQGGRVAVFQRRDGGWVLEAQVTPPGAGENADAGWAVAMADGTAVVGAPDAGETGQAYVLRATDEWAVQRRLVGADLHPDAAFGTAVAAADGSTLVGAPALGAATPAYLFGL